MKIAFLILLLLLSGYIHAADGDSQNAFIELTVEESIKFAQAICDTEIGEGRSCEYGEYDSFGPFVFFEEGYFWPKSVIYGSFTSSHEDEAFVDLLVSDTEFNYSSALFRYQNGKWNYIAFNENGGQNCSTFKSAEYRDFLVCGVHWTDYGFDFGFSEDDASIYAEYGSTFDIETLQFEDDTIAFKPLLKVVNPYNVFCDEMDQENKGKTYLGDFSWSHKDVNADLSLDLILEFYGAKIDDISCFTKQGFSNPSIVRPVRLIWLFDGFTFTLTSETKAFLDGLIG
jgi:hypothetical protein